MQLSGNIVLVGPMGAGKTTIGRRLAQRLQRVFYDSDHEIEHRTGVDIPFIFEKEGEAGFRKRETLMLDELTQYQNIILATGGGAILAEQNRQYLRDRGIVVYLRASVEQQLARIRHDQHRPLLNTPDRAGTLRRLFAQRDPLYQNTAHFIIKTDGRRTPDLCNEIIDTIKAHHANTHG